MPGPKYDPGFWNAPATQPVNNCYNYATNKPFSPLAGFPPPAMPGRASGVTVGVTIGWDRSGAVPAGPPAAPYSVMLVPYALLITCEGVKGAATLDGLTAQTDGKCPPDCWPVAYYVLPPVPDPAPPFYVSGDCHFIRQDEDGKWSHKPGLGKAHRNQWNPATSAFDGPEITDPATAAMEPGFKFCGYLCVCANVKVAVQEPIESGQGDASAIIYRAGASGVAGTLAFLEGGRFPALADAWRTNLRAAWRTGFGPGELRYRIDVGARPRPPAASISILVHEHSVTLWQGGAARHFLDRGGSIAGLVRGWFAARTKR